MVVLTEEMKAKAEIYHGDELGQVKTKELLQEVGLPNGLLPLENIIECGIVRETGFVWLKQKKKIEHKFEKVGKLVSYATDVTAYVEKLKIKKLTGVKVRELLLWITLTEIYIENPLVEKITFKSFTGISKDLPTPAFQIEDVKQISEVKEVKEEEKVEEGAKE
ncbi:hypothetical protein GIB67_001449 [Kingdonia uniflora]|uniref:Uncharacterized protein n=1 Tax=Kingdonia uniflora TaxID=39325 RepID=A0A7J7L6X5_9MAGN|nr:hypothetical protein GIB67_001449 [Kingdonia uniflora]